MSTRTRQANLPLFDSISHLERDQRGDCLGCYLTGLPPCSLGWNFRCSRLSNAQEHSITLAKSTNLPSCKIEKQLKVLGSLPSLQKAGALDGRSGSSDQIWSYNSGRSRVTMATSRTSVYSLEHSITRTLKFKRPSSDLPGWFAAIEFDFAEGNTPAEAQFKSANSESRLIQLNSRRCRARLLNLAAEFGSESRSRISCQKKRSTLEIAVWNPVSQSNTNRTGTGAV